MANTAMDEFIAQYLPSAQFMQLEVDAYNGKSLHLKAPLGPNINDKNTAFGGSIYCVSVMACWGMVYMRCVDYGLDPDIVIAKAEIEYLKPVTGDILAKSLEADENRWNDFFSRYEERGRARMALSSEVHVNGELAVKFSGNYAIIGEKSRDSGIK
ncbi:thioesterase-like protein [Spongiibacter sp. IMCC21906]|uniref:YiiD C-terminal domain-containing protein n=1 Tax=Spongiibacter sp. IMCC21906 TaxID=1620392 RepID=UPI00062DD570|nr:YiiD C-terminal domain-containing protein [Spongiibacter sp. IMCC21906]AKH69654.1 thioesterase-like protein [Spongiibacter sp. IMCC21906]